jgi:hypothetical protein
MSSATAATAEPSTATVLFIPVQSSMAGRRR